MSHPTQYRSFQSRPLQEKIAHTHNNGTKSLTFTESLTFIKHNTQKMTETYNCKNCQL